MTAARNGIGTPNSSRGGVPKRYSQRELSFRVWSRDGGCVLRHFDPADCDGVHDGAHLVPKHTIKRSFGSGAVYDHKTRIWNPVGRFQTPELSIDQILMDERNVIAACRLHHGLFDNGQLTLPDDATPNGFPAFLREFGFEHNGRYWALVAA